MAKAKNKSKLEIRTELVDFSGVLKLITSKESELPSREALATVLQTAQKVIKDLEVEVLLLRKQMFGRRSEKIVPGQLSLFAKTLEAVVKRAEAELKAATSEDVEKTDGATAGSESEPNPEVEDDKPKKEKKPRRKLKPTRTEVISVPEEEQPCPKCGAPRCPIGHSKSLMVEYIPAKFEVIEFRRETLACRACDGEVVQAPPPELRVREGAWPGPKLLSQLAINKSVDGLPLHRTRRRFQRAGGDFGISTLNRWEGFAHELLIPLIDCLRDKVRGADIIHLDDTSLRVRDKDAEGGVVKGRVWVFCGLYFDPGGDLSKTTEYVSYAYAPTWEAKHPESWLDGCTAALHGDAYRGYERIASPRHGDRIKKLLAGCWMHARRPFAQAHELGDETAKPFVEAFQHLYWVEAMAKEQHLTAPQRLELRRDRSLPTLRTLLARAQELVALPLPKLMQQGVTYLTNQWEKLMVPFQDGRFEIDNKLAEQRLRRVASGRKAWLFAGNKGGAERFADILSITSSCDAAGVDCGKYLPNIIQHINDWPAKRIQELLPGPWRAECERVSAELKHHQT